MVYEIGPSIKDCIYQRRSRNLTANKVNITQATKFVGEKENCLSNEANEQTLIQLIMERMRQSGCDVIQAEGDADVEIAKAAINISAFKPNTLVGEDTDFFVLLLYHAVLSNVSISISNPTRWNQTSIISKSSSWCLEKQFARTYCFSMPLLGATRCPEYLTSGRSQRSNESSRTKRQWKTGRPPSHCSI